MKRGCVITIGSFDGVHRGHATLFQWTKREAQRRGIKPVVLTFGVPPRVVLDRIKKPTILTGPNEKKDLIQKAGIRDVEFIEFNKGLSKVRPFVFFRDVLLKRFGAKGLVAGADFRFGMDRSAGAKELVRWGLESEMPVWVVPPVKWRRQTISSTLIRQLIAENGL